jgi:hypothetical protein
MPTVDDAYPSRYADPAKHLGTHTQLRIRAVTYEEGDYPRYCLELDELDGTPWSDGQLARIPPGQAKILGFSFGPVPEGWVGHVIELSTQQGNVQGKGIAAWWCVMPRPQQPRVNPAPPPSPPRPEPPAANTRPRVSEPAPAAPLEKFKRYAKRKDGGNSPPPKAPDPDDPIDDLIKY